MATTTFAASNVPASDSTDVPVSAVSRFDALLSPRVREGVVLTLLILCWSFCSSIAYGTARVVLRGWTFPLTLFIITLITSIAVLALLFHVIRATPQQNAPALVSLRSSLIIAFAQSLGYVLTYVAYSKVSVPFVQIIRSADTLITLALSVLLFGKSFPWGVYLALPPIAFGVALTSVAEARFDALGMVLALTSTVCFVLRAVITKDTLRPLDAFNVFDYLSKLSLALTVPFWLFLEAPQLFFNATPLTPLLGGVSAELYDHAHPVAWLAGTALAKTPAVVFMSPVFLGKLCLVAVPFALYNIASYVVLMRVSALTHSVCNVMRRAVLIISNILWFGLSVSWLSYIGMTTVFVGTYFYTVQSHAHAIATAQAKYSPLSTAATESSASASTVKRNGQYARVADDRDDEAIELTSDAISVTPAASESQAPTSEHA